MDNRVTYFTMWIVEGYKELEKKKSGAKILEIKEQILSKSPHRVADQ